MNLAHLKYAVEVSKTGSVSKAAENLYIGQPNLSKAIKELEESLGFTIFNRRARGVTPTEKGEEFLVHAKRIVAEINEFEELYRSPDKGRQSFRAAVPHCFCTAEALSNFAGKLDPETDAEICFTETSAMDAVSKLLNDNYNLAVIRIKSEYTPNFLQFIREKGLKSELLFEFRYRALMSENHRLAKESAVSREKLAGGIEILWGCDPVPSLTAARERKPGRQILISDRGSQYELLSEIPGSFMWESPIKAEILRRYGLVQRDAADAEEGKYLLVCPSFYKLTKLDRMYLEELSHVIENFGK